MEYSIGNEKSRKNVDGIVQMAQKHGRSEKESRGNEYFLQALVFPVYEAHEKGKTGVGRKEKVVLGRESFV